MRNADQDLDELERLLGPAKGAYRGLRHEVALPEAPARSFPIARLAVAASLLIAVLGLGLASLDPSPAGKSRLSMPGPVTAGLSLRPAAVPRLPPARVTVSLSMPKAPRGSNG